MTTPARFAPSLALALALLAGPIVSQGSIRHANVTYRVGSIGTTQSESVDCDFTAEPTAGSDVLSEHWWYFRIDGDTEESVLRNDGTLTQNYAGTHADLYWSDVDRRGQLRVHLALSVASLGPTNGLVVSRLTVLNISSKPIRLNLFNYVDIDACTPDSDTATGPGASHTVSGSCPGVGVRFEGTFPTHWFLEGQDGSECDLLDAGPLTLPDQGLPFGPGNYTGALQWGEFSLGPGARHTVSSVLEHNPRVCAPASTASYGAGLGGTFGVPTISTPAPPHFGSMATVAVDNAFPLTPGILIFGFIRTNIPVANLTILMLPGPKGTAFDAFALPTNLRGALRLQVPIPSLRNLCGKQIQWQYFFPDPAAPGPFRLAHTNAVEWTLGS